MMKGKFNEKEKEIPDSTDCNLIWKFRKIFVKIIALHCSEGEYKNDKGRNSDLQS